MVKVVIAITTYNLEQYIGNAIDSVLQQKTNFKFKILIADDCSNDGTQQILKKYKETYPDIIEILWSDQNLGSLANANRLFDGLQCQYFSFLDGDDYWLGEDRLQKQIDFMDNNPQYMLCAGNTQYLKEGKLEKFLINKSDLNKSYTFQDMLDNKMPFFHTSSIMVRNTIFVNGLPKCYKEVVNTFENCALRGEDFRRILHLERGPLYAFDEVFSVYRIHSKGLWQGSSGFKRMLESTISYNYYSKYFGSKYGDYFVIKTKECYKEMIKMLIVDKYLLDAFSLTEQEVFLLLSLLSNINGIYDYKFKKSKAKKIFLEIFFKMYRSLG